MGAGRRHGIRRSLPSVYLMPVPGPSALREAPSGEGGARRGAPAEPSSWGQRAAGGGRNFFQNLPLAGCALSQVRDWEGCGPRDGKASGPAGYPVHRSPTEVVGPVNEIRGVREIASCPSIIRSCDLLFPGPFFLIPLSKDQMTYFAPAASYCPPGLLVCDLSFPLFGKKS